jgi:hypothetical protein
VIWLFCFLAYGFGFPLEKLYSFFMFFHHHYCTQFHNNYNINMKQVQREAKL